jgi:two-component system cell cycle sensor histidine kinase/response regulator CckA
VLATGSWVGELTQLTKTGHAFTADCRWQLARDDHGSPLHMMCIVSHEREQQHVQERRYRAQRLESVGLLAGGIAHNLNNVLAPLLLTAQYVGANESNRELKRLLESMEPIIKRGSEMISQLLAYSQGEEGQRTQVDVRVLVDELERFCDDTLTRSIEVQSDIDLDHPFFLGDSTQIMQVLVNLATNARDAMPDGGTFGIRVYNHDLHPGDHEKKARRVIAIEATDSGSGMDAETVVRAFEPFFSTKDVGKGTGLGLSTSRSIAHGHGGELTILGTPGTGTRIQLLLPATEEASGPAAITRRTVLVVEDDAPLRAVVQATLESHGYRALGALHGKEAIALIESGQHLFDLVVTDLMMPEMDGRALEEYLYAHHPELPVITVSGLSTGARVAQTLSSGSDRFLRKPFSTGDLLTAVDRELVSDNP